MKGIIAGLFVLFISLSAFSYECKTYEAQFISTVKSQEEFSSGYCKVFVNEMREEANEEGGKQYWEHILCPLPQGELLQKGLLVLKAHCSKYTKGKDISGVAMRFAKQDDIYLDLGQFLGTNNTTEGDPDGDDSEEISPDQE